MKIKLTILVAMMGLLSYAAVGQIPQGINYQAIVRDASGTLIANQNTIFVISIKRGNVNGPNVYQETHNVTTDGRGLATMKVGMGTPTGGSFSGINWSIDKYYMNVNMNGVNVGTTQFVSVPYALQANYAQKGSNLFAIDSSLVLTNKNDSNFIHTDKFGKLHLSKNNMMSGNAAVTVDDNSNNVGIYEVNPEATLDVSGRVRVQEVTSVSAAPATKTMYGNLVPLAYAAVSHSGTNISHSGFGVSNVSKPFTGQYELVLHNGWVPGIKPVVLVTAYNDGPEVEVPTYEIETSTKKIIVYISNVNGVAKNSSFSVMVMGYPAE